ncbi:hypothetical protein GF488_24685 [Klebsiella pneumoniae]|nr:hypothetical protein [Klebsiella pneumoniae]
MFWLFPPPSGAKHKNPISPVGFFCASILAEIAFPQIRGRLRERAKSYAKALANDILR